MRWQFIRFYIGTVVVLLIAAGVLYLVVKRDFENSMDERLARYMASWVSTVRDSLADAPEDREVRAQMLEEIEYKPKYPPHRERGKGEPPPSHLAEREELSLSDDELARIDNGDVVVVREGEKRLVYAALSGRDILVVEPTPRRSRDRDGDRTKGLLVLLAPPLTVLLLIGAVVYLLIRPIERRISSLSDVTRSFGAGALDARAQVGRTGTLDELEESFNAMASRIEKLVDSQRELMRAVSHDLRTPLARVFFALDEAHSAKTAEEKNEHLMRIDRSLVDLNDLVDELRTFLHLDEAGMKPEQEWIDLPPVFRDAIDLVSDLRQDVAFELSCDEPRIFADPRYLKRAVRNLVTNAVTFAEKGVWITCQRGEKAFTLSVHDDGAGIPESEREKIFEPFYRRDQSRNMELGGSGLGLAIVSRIMAWHGGSVTVHDSPHGGACFTLSFSVEQSESASPDVS